MNEMMVKFGKSKERLNILDGMQEGPVGNDRELLRIHLDSFCADDVTQILYFGLVELAFFYVGEESMFAEPIQYHLTVMVVFLLIFGKYQDIVQIDHAYNVQ